MAIFSSRGSNLASIFAEKLKTYCEIPAFKPLFLMKIYSQAPTTFTAIYPLTSFKCLQIRIAHTYQKKKCCVPRLLYKYLTAEVSLNMKFKLIFLVFIL